MLTYLSNNLPSVSVPDSHYVAICSSFTSEAIVIAAVYIHCQLCAMKPCPILHASTEAHVVNITRERIFLRCLRQNDTSPSLHDLSVPRSHDQSCRYAHSHIYSYGHDDTAYSRCHIGCSHHHCNEALMATSSMRRTSQSCVTRIKEKCTL